jgi:hypothetical protein
MSNYDTRAFTDRVIRINGEARQLAENIIKAVIGNRTTDRTRTMSRHEIPAKNPAHKVIVGWDAGLSTYFAQVMKPSLHPRRAMVLLWIGTEPGEIGAADSLRPPLARYADLPAEVLFRLVDDRLNADPPSPLQQQMQDLLRRGR